MSDADTRPKITAAVREIAAACDRMERDDFDLHQSAGRFAADRLTPLGETIELCGCGYPANEDRTWWAGACDCARHVEQQRKARDARDAADDDIPY